MLKSSHARPNLVSALSLVPLELHTPAPETTAVDAAPEAPADPSSGVQLIAATALPQRGEKLPDSMKKARRGKPAWFRHAVDLVFRERLSVRRAAAGGDLAEVVDGALVTRTPDATLSAIATEFVRRAAADLVLVRGPADEVAVICLPVTVTAGAPPMTGPAVRVRTEEQEAFYRGVDIARGSCADELEERADAFAAEGYPALADALREAGAAIRTWRGVRREGDS